MTTQNRTTTDSRDELIAKIMQAYKSLPPNRREAILSILREIAAKRNAEKTVLPQTSAK